MVVNSAVLAHDVRHVSLTCRWGSASFLLAEFHRCHSKNWKTVKLRQCSISVKPIREGEIPQACEIPCRHVSGKIYCNHDENDCKQGEMHFSVSAANDVYFAKSDVAICLRSIL